MAINRFQSSCLAVLFTVIVSLISAQDGQELSYTMPEESPIGHVIADVIDAARLRDVYAADVLPTLEYFFLSQNPRFESYFDIDTHTGVLSIARPIDRDVICAGMTQCVANMDIGIRPVRHFRQIKVFVTVTDINDNVPSFEESSVVIGIPENGIEGKCRARTHLFIAPVHWVLR